MVIKSKGKEIKEIRLRKKAKSSKMKNILSTGIKEMEAEKNILEMVNYNLKENLKKGKNGMEKGMI